MIIDVFNCGLKIFLISVFIPILFSHFTFSKIFTSRSSKKAYYGATCNSTVKCDIHSLLFCEDNICQCLYSDAMTYNFDLGTCVSLVNEICGYVETKRVFINCISNSFCDQQQGVCKCAQGFVEGDRQCLKQKGYGEPCHSDNECLSELSLTCFEETCRCDPKRYVPYSAYVENSNLNITQTRCVALAGLPCTVKTGCVTKAACVNEIDTLDSSPNFDWMSPGICKCDDGYEMDNNGRCVGKYGSYCDVLANISCLESFQCLDSVCHCKFPDDQIYNEGVRKCVSLINGPCTANGIYQLDDTGIKANEETDVHCDKFMECVKSTCVCTNGFVENIDRGCDLSYGQPCTGETMSKCDKAVGLHCVNGLCACKDARREFDLTLGRCIGKIGAPCKVSPVKSSSPTGLQSGRRNRKTSNEKLGSDGEHSCSGNAKCKISRIHLKGLTTRGFCMLPEGGTLVPAVQDRNYDLQNDMNLANHPNEEGNEDQDYE